MQAVGREVIVDVEPMEEHGETPVGSNGEEEGEELVRDWREERGERFVGVRWKGRKVGIWGGSHREKCRTVHAKLIVSAEHCAGW